jgi:hypothetical protein
MTGQIKIQDGSGHTKARQYWMRQDQTGQDRMKKPRTEQTREDRTEKVGQNRTC